MDRGGDLLSETLGSSAASTGTAHASDILVWQRELRERIAEHLVESIQHRCREHVRDVEGAQFLADTLGDFVVRGKYLRSTFTYLGWLCGRAESEAALRASASAELLQCFTLIQDDVMDEARQRRGTASMHVRLANWHAGRGFAGSSARFGESTAILLADLCLVWAAQTLRESGLDEAALGRAWPLYDAMRSELAVGQFADLVNDAQRTPDIDAVLDVLRRKSGNYTVRRPLELGAKLAGCDSGVLHLLGEYGALVGEAFQLRDDLLGVFGMPDETGKDDCGDLRQRKATSLVVLARTFADATERRELERFARAEDLSEDDVRRWRDLIKRTGAPDVLEGMIEERVRVACMRLDDAGLDAFVSAALRHLALRCTDRDH